MISQGYEKKQGNNDTSNLKTFTCNKMQNGYAKKKQNKNSKVSELNHSLKNNHREEHKLQEMKINREK